jgi:hypothetical protein
MAKRTGTQIKSDLTAVGSALTTAITTPTLANLAAVVTAASVVDTNSRDSRDIVGTDGELVGSSFSGIARSVRREVQNLIRNGHGQSVIPAADTRKQLRKIAGAVTSVNGPYAAYLAKGTTT